MKIGYIRISSADQNTARQEVLMQELGELGHGAFHGRDDVAGEQFGEVVEKAAVEVVDAALVAGPEVEAEQVGIHGHDEHMPQHGGGRHARRLGPAYLEAEHAGKVGHSGQSRGRRRSQQLIHTVHGVQGQQALIKGRADLLHFLVEEIQRLDEAELPARGVEMRGAEDTVGQRRHLFGRAAVIGDEPLPEPFVQRAYARLQLGEYPGRELFVMVSVLLDAIEHGRLDVGDDKPVEIIEKSAFDDVEADAALFVGRQVFGVLLPEQEGHDHLVGLLIQLE